MRLIRVLVAASMVMALALPVVSVSAEPSDSEYASVDYNNCWCKAIDGIVLPCTFNFRDPNAHLSCVCEGDQYWHPQGLAAVELVKRRTGWRDDPRGQHGLFPSCMPKARNPQGGTLGAHMRTGAAPNYNHNYQPRHN